MNDLDFVLAVTGCYFAIIEGINFILLQNILKDKTLLFIVTSPRDSTT
jgi:hypothetical protein